MHEGWMRTRTPDGSDPPAHLLWFARKAMGDLLEAAKKGGLVVTKRVHHLPDGSVVTVEFDGTTPTATISPVSQEASKETDFGSLWVPRGFIVYPAWSTAVFGVGLPIVQDTTVSAYSSRNLSPGLSRARWTAGGPCGEVLISPDHNAGYPDYGTNPAPLLADSLAGPQTLRHDCDVRAPGEAWRPYRLELAPFIQYTSLDNPSQQYATFIAANQARLDAGRPAATLRFRGFAHVAEMAAGVFAAAGSIAETSTSYPTTFRSSADRLTKDGYSIAWGDANITSFARSDVFAAVELRDLGSPLPTLITNWSAAGLTADVGSCVTLDIGYRNGYSAAALTARDRWLEAGNANWQSPIHALPPISWHSFASMNLSWETQPSVFDAVNGPTLTYSFTGTYGDCWLIYPRSTTIEPAFYDPAMGRHIYCRGRSIALAPRGGLVWAAAVARVGTVDRLLALVHHPEDQPTDKNTDGSTRYLRLWWADIPPRRGIRLMPQKTICGEDTGDTWSWRGGHLLDVGVMPAPASGPVASAGTNSLKYASVWKFAADGSKAVCLRDYGTRADYASDVSGSSALTQLISVRMPRTVELLFTHGPTDTTANVVFYDYLAGQLASPAPVTTGEPPLSGDTLLSGGSPAQLLDYGAQPTAVDYDRAGVLRYAFTVSLSSASVAVAATYASPLTYSYAGVGRANATHLGDLSFAVLLGTSFKTTHQDFELNVVQVLDIGDAVFVVSGAHPRRSVDITNLSGGASITPSTVVTTPCLTYSGALVHGVRMFRRGGLLNESWYTSPDGAAWWPVARCLDSGVNGYVALPLAVSSAVQGSYAVRFDAYVVSYQVAPMPYTLRYLSAAPTDGTCGCNVKQTDLSGASFMTPAMLAPRGGKAVASVGLPSHDWLIYAKVV